jgi:hypothetical protein
MSSFILMCLIIGIICGIIGGIHNIYLNNTL